MIQGAGDRTAPERDDGDITSLKDHFEPLMETCFAGRGRARGLQDAQVSAGLCPAFQGAATDTRTLEECSCIFLYMCIDINISALLRQSNIQP